MSRVLVSVADEAGEIARLSALDAKATVELIGDFLGVVLVAVDTGLRISSHDLGSFRQLGGFAAEQGVRFAAVLDLYLSATWRLWDAIRARSSDVSSSVIASAAGIMLRAADDVAEALAEGYAATQRRTMRFEESMRREFVDDLLAGTTTPDLLELRANRFGFNITGLHHVVVARTNRLLSDAGPVHFRVENQVATSFGTRDVIVATKQGLLVCVFPGESAEAESGLLTTLNATGEGPWAIGVGRPDRGPTGVVRSYQEARGALELETRLDRGVAIARYESLLAYRVIMSDSALTREMVANVLGPLEMARGGAEPLVATLRAHFETGGNVSATARMLHLSARAVTYRLERITQLSGHSFDVPEQRFVLELAVRAAVLVVD